jgi:RNA polymerase sigma-70 factor (ECF subfamily)
MVSECAGPISGSGEAEADGEELALIDRARAGDMAAADCLITRYRQRVVRLAAHVLGSADEAEDAAQEAFIRAFRSLKSYRSDARFYTWLYRIVVRVCLDRRRLASWRAETPLDLVAAGIASSGAELAEADLLMAVRSLMAQLDPSMRAVLVLRELEGLEYEEIAKVLNIPVGRVRWRLHAARAMFQKLWRSAAEEADRV